MPYKKVGITTLVNYTWWELDPVTDRHVACAEIREYVTYTVVWEDPAAWCREMGEIAMMKKKSQEAAKGKTKWVPSGDPFFKPFPTIEQHLGDAIYEDGSPRECSKLTVQVGIGTVAIQLTDPDNRSTAFTNGESVMDAMTLLEEALVNNRNPWRAWPKHFGKK